MKDNIKYEELSQDIKKEIDKYYKKEKGKNEDIFIEEAMFKWFDNCFDEWIRLKYGDDLNADKRKHFRLDIELPVRILDTLIESTKDESTAINFIGTILNISRGGLYFKSDKHIEVSSIIMVKIDLTDIDKNLKNIEALAMVMRSDKINKNEYGIGIMFSSIYDDHKENLDMFIFRNVAIHIHSTRNS